MHLDTCRQQMATGEDLSSETRYDDQNSEQNQNKPLHVSQDRQKEMFASQ